MHPARLGSLFLLLYGHRWLFLFAFLGLSLTRCIASGQISPLLDPDKTFCISDNDCLYLEICTPTKVCIPRTPSCNTQNDCTQGKFCSGGLCLEPGLCYFDYQCPANTVCRDYRCIPFRCQSQSDCPEGKICDSVSGSCREKGCLSNNDCLVNECCNSIAGFCAPAFICERYEKGIPADCNPTPELCDQVDNDCDGAIDEDFPQMGSNCQVGTGNGPHTFSRT